MFVTIIVIGIFFGLLSLWLKDSFGDAWWLFVLIGLGVLASPYIILFAWLIFNSVFG